MGNIVESHIRDGITSLTISAGTALSATIDLAFMRLAAIQMPAAWTAASITFQGSVGTGIPDNLTFNDVYTSGGVEYTVTASASKVILIPYADLFGLRFIKIRSGTTGTPVQQAADRILLLSRTA